MAGVNGVQVESIRERPVVRQHAGVDGACGVNGVGRGVSQGVIEARRERGECGWGVRVEWMGSVHGVGWMGNVRVECEEGHSGSAPNAIIHEPVFDSSVSVFSRIVSVFSSSISVFSCNVVV